MLDEYLSLPLSYLATLYFAGGVATVVACWVYDQLLLALQDYDDEISVSAFGFLLQIFLWPLVLIFRTIVLPWHLWVAYQTRRSD